jgi:hypothetical protein
MMADQARDVALEAVYFLVEIGSLCRAHRVSTSSRVLNAADASLPAAATGECRRTRRKSCNRNGATRRVDPADMAFLRLARTEARLDQTNSLARSFLKFRCRSARENAEFRNADGHSVLESGGLPDSTTAAR